MSDSEMVRRTLLDKRAELVVRRDSVSADMHRTSGALSADFAEQAVERQNDEVLERIGDATFAEIASIDRALARLNAGRYGTCAQCRKPIDARRLAAWPYAETCVSCSK